MSQVADVVRETMDEQAGAPTRAPSSAEKLAAAILSSPDRQDGEPHRDAAPVLDTIARRAFWELRHARLRLAVAENDLAWAQELLVDGSIAPGVALNILDEILEDIGGVRP